MVEAADTFRAYRPIRLGVRILYLNYVDTADLLLLCLSISECSLKREVWLHSDISYDSNL
jgi:hypothetical protein